jgi:endonuclease/exonuclease/phosphatase family metal-dependent hydrolase
MNVVDLVTLNIWHDSGPWPQRRELIVDELIRLKPDLVGLQEVLGRPDAPGQADELAGALGYEAVHAPASRRSDGAWLGNGLLSRLPVRRKETIPLPAGDVEPRSLLFAVVDTLDGELPVFVTHLAWEPELGTIRSRQVEAALRAIDERVAALPDALPAVLMGDFNASPGAEELAALADGWLDAWSVGGHGPGATFDPENDYARAWEEPAERIDYVFVEDDPRALVRRTELAFVAPVVVDGERVWPSDHFGISCRLELA